MTLGEIGSLGEAIGAVATVATLFYLALQIRANTLASKRKSLDDIIDRVVRWETRLVDSPDLIRSWLDGHKSYGGLPLEGQLRFQALMVEILASFESNFEAGKFGDVKPEAVDVIKTLTAHLFQSEGVREWWKASGQLSFAADFVREVDLIFEEIRTTYRDLPGPLPFRVPSADPR
jgi:hypothetical protein